MKANAIYLLGLIFVFALYAQGQELNRDTSTDLLKIVIEGGTQGFVDETYIHFHEDATTGYDIEIDAKKWWSYDPQATMIWTIASDNTDLAINNLPLDDLHSNLNTIPLQFVCGYGGGEYTMTFSELHTFDESVEIWLEDLRNSDGWLLMSENESTYTFSGLPDEASDRFRIHILDPTTLTDVDEPKAVENSIRIYAVGNKIYINSKDDIQIKEMMIFNIYGQKVPFYLNYASPKLSTIDLNEPTGYYVIRLTVDNHYYSEKIFIKKF